MKLKTEDSGSRPLKAKDIEKRNIYSAIYSGRGYNRKVITELLGLRPTSVSNAVNELIEDRLVFEAPLQSTGRKGRPEQYLALNTNRFVAISITIVSREICGALINCKGEPLVQISKFVDKPAKNDEFMEIFSSIIDYILSKVSLGSEITGISFSLSGIVNQSANLWITTLRWPHLSNLSLTPLADHYKLPITIHRIINSNLLNLLERTPHYKEGGTVLFHWGWSVVLSFALNGKVIYSSTSNFGNIGHHKTTQEQTVVCSCGQQGCLETQTALWALLPLFKKGDPDTPPDESHFYDYFKTLDLKKYDFFSKSISYIAESLDIVYKLFCPDRILIYGPFCERSDVAAMLLNLFSGRERIRYTETPAQLEFLDHEIFNNKLGEVSPFFDDKKNPYLLARW